MNEPLYDCDLGARPPKAGLAPVQPEPADKLGLKRGARILAATTRQSLLRAMKMAVLAAGLSLSVSPDGLHALMSAVQQPPELIILDEDIGGVDSDSVERMLARDARTCNVPIVRVRAQSKLTPLDWVTPDLLA